jgi:multidrug efflux pump subunit AcrA (membrane-fusion protein)
LGSYLLVVDDNNIVVRRPVKLGIQAGDSRAVEEGLSDQDWVIVTGLLRAIPGNTVKPIRKPQAKIENKGNVSATPANQEKPIP